MDKQNLGRITESRTDINWGSPAQPIKSAAWFATQKYEAATLSTGQKTDRQWYVYDAASLIIKGSCTYQIIADALAPEGLIPVKDRAGNAIVALWLNEIKDAVCGAYHEIVISVDVTTNPDGATAAFGSGSESVGYLYNFFKKEPSQYHYLHSLFINSPLSIMWGREMQAFPKHPKPVKSQLNNETDKFSFDLKWDDALIMSGKVHKRWGIQPFLFQALNLITHFGLGTVLGYLTNPNLPVPIQMPSKTAAQYQIKRDYFGTIHKGYNPTAVRTWAWDDRYDQLELGEISYDTGSEQGNGHLHLLKKGGFQPKICIYMPLLQAHVI